jgi:hypothetical protein
MKPEAAATARDPQRVDDHRGGRPRRWTNHAGGRTTQVDELHNRGAAEPGHVPDRAPADRPARPARRPPTLHEAGEPGLQPRAGRVAHDRDHHPHAEVDRYEGCRQVSARQPDAVPGVQPVVDGVPRR